MEGDTAPEEIGDVAYGIFEIILNKGLKSRGDYLFERVEREDDFRQDFEEIFSDFTTDYEILANALLEKFTDTNTIYNKICEGEGVFPSKTTQMYWIVQDAPDFEANPDDENRGGKWLIFLERDVADLMWRKIRDATVKGRLGISAKTSTAKENPDSRDDRIVIYVHTKDWEDADDVMNIREVLRELGVEQRIGYKRNIETYHGDYSEGGKKVTYYSA
ncbi:DUF1917 domain-containing protein [Methanoplanus sp. FWC-SCC4]|uniref:DUF1917 domain-containing protein n=1 Tax=Methanochimaera problematica TaxID=2609417 RepID=A0AA97I380_9EURY|nr:putative phosphothreonine lyase domain-containg protein [Methanoplanus sp. FWC-SCC4]WOF17070.1 DUF1917 domain-containing protein [Methanoplanus sp. FWC-SCC4]